jgi:fumarate hydratase subunit alpha
MREIAAQSITDTVARLCQEANFDLPEDVLAAFRRAAEEEPSPAGREALRQLVANAELARRERWPLCQDCGLAVVMLEIGQDAHVTGGYLYDAVHEGVRQGYREGFLRKSAVRQPILDRRNTGDNTPAIIHAEIVPGDQLRILVMPKGAGSENKSALAMLTPADGEQGVADFVVRTVENAGASACPPMVIVGVGIGGTTDKVTYLAKKALARPLGQPNPDPGIAAFERELLDRVNATGIGPAGFGGRTTALAVHVETFPAHIASLPVAVNIQCNSARTKEAVL